MEEVREGGLSFLVDEVRDGASEGTGSGVFYNPTQELNRDVTVAALRAYREREPRAETYLDAMAASGIRGVRAADAGYDVTCADRDPDAVALARRNFERNGLAGDVVERDANALLYDAGAVDVVDLDPFGSPVPFADAALSNARDLVAVTATDTAPLCGAHFAAGVRRYGAVPRNTEYHPEMGLRVLCSALVRTAARYDVAATPVLSHVSRHYVRTYLELEGGAGAADDALDELGHVHHCQDCLVREAERGLLADGPDACPACGSARVVTAGPLWLGPVRERGFVAAVRGELDAEMGTADEARDLLGTVEAELDTPTHYDQHRLCRLWGRPASAMDDFLDALRAAGHEATRAHYGGTTFKTTATVPEMRAATADLGD
ncbi:MAG: tRNA (guanine(26)-N(2))-dimethyltransferase [Haloferacaceae archaeon]